MTIHLPPDIERSLQAAVQCGHFASIDDALTKAASLLLERLKASSPSRRQHPHPKPPRHTSQYGRRF